MKSILLLVIIGSVLIYVSGVTFDQSLLILAQLSSNNSYPNNPTQTLGEIPIMTNSENNSSMDSTKNLPAPM